MLWAPFGVYSLTFRHLQCSAAGMSQGDTGGVKPSTLGARSCTHTNGCSSLLLWFPSQMQGFYTAFDGSVQPEASV